jgi:hypothetical protein
MVTGKKMGLLVLTAGNTVPRKSCSVKVNTLNPLRNQLGFLGGKVIQTTAHQNTQTWTYIAIVLKRKVSVRHRFIELN